MKRMEILLAAVFISLNIVVPINVSATEKENTLKNDIIYATSLIEELLTEEYELKLESIKTALQESEYDYVLSMESLYEKGNPFANADYQSMIAAYLAVSREGFNITDMEFIKIDYKEAYITEYKPVKTYEYILREDGYYDRGNIKYITSEVKTGVYEKNSDGTYALVGEELVAPEQIKTPYLDITVSLADKDHLLKEYATSEEAADEYEERLRKIKDAGLSREGLSQSVFINYATEFTISPPAQQALSEALTSVDGNRNVILLTASSLIGKIPYEWGGKASSPGYDNSWWTMNENGKQNGLDCSGFVQWVFMTSGYGKDVYEKLLSTRSIASSVTQIRKEELMPGDIGLYHDGSEGVNHTGIYVGDGYYIHCSSQANTVTVTKAPFTLFYRVNETDTAVLNTVYYDIPAAVAHTQEDVELLTEFIISVAPDQGLNSWVALTEMIINRLNNENYPDTIKDVLIQGNLLNNDNPVTTGIEENVKLAVTECLSGRIRIIQDESIVNYININNITNEETSIKPALQVNGLLFY